MAVRLELRYRGLRSPHKIKLGVSGCARECAEARGKDVGIIATDKGWNLYVGGNGGFTPKHARLLAEDLDTETLVRTIDRFLMYYVRTADRLQRTAPWVEEHEGGLDAIRAVVIDDSLGIADDLDAAMAAHVGGYRDEWAATLADPDKLARFRERDGLTITLLSDADKSVMTAWGAYGEKKLYGKVVEGVIRSTVVVGPDGVVTHAQYNVKATGHVARIRRDLGIE